jgi:hypothetical protein
VVDAVFKFFKFNYRIGIVHPPHLFLGTPFAGGMNMALDQQAFFFAC